MLLLAGLAEQVQVWQEIFGGGPLAAFIGVLLVAVVTIFWLYVRAIGRLAKEQSGHLDTVRETVALTIAMEHTWSEQLKKNEADDDLQRKTIDALSRAVTLLEWARQQSRPP